MQDLLTAAALVLVFEGVVWSLFPVTMQRMATQMATVQPSGIRVAGLAAATVGVLGVWLIRR